MKKYLSIFSVALTTFVLLSHSSFAGSLELVDQSSIPTANRTIYYCVDSVSYNNLATAISQFVADVSKDTNTNYKVFKVIVDNPKDIRATLKKGYEEDDLWGAFLIGRISPFTYSGETDSYGLPRITNHFYEALYFPIDYVDGGNMIETQFSNLLPSYWSQIWLGIIYPSKSGFEGVNQIGSYLQRNHLYRLGQLTFQKKFYFSEAMGESDYDFNYYSSLLSDIFTDHPLFSFNDIDISVEVDANSQKSDFLNALDNNYEMLFLNTHGSPWSIYFTGSNSTGAWLRSDELPVNARSPKYIEMVSCGTGHFTEENYFAGELLFNGDTLLVFASTEVLLVSDSYITSKFNEDYYALGLGASFADIYVPLMGGQGALNFFGDPTLVFREKPTQNIPRLTISGIEEVRTHHYLMDFGTVYDNASKTVFLSLSNTGAAPLLMKAFMVSSQNSYNDFYSIGGTNGFLFSFNTPGVLNLDQQIQAGDTLSLPFRFDPGSIYCLDMFGQGCNAPWVIYSPEYGRYNGVFSFFTSDPDIPGFIIEVKGYNSTHDCDAVLSSDSKLYIPIITYSGTSYWGYFEFDPNTLSLTLINVNEVSDTSPFKNCTYATISQDLSLQLPSIAVGDVYCWADFQYSHDLIWTLSGAGLN